MKPTLIQRAVLLSLADNSAQLRSGSKHYRLLHGRGDRIDPRTVKTLFQQGWVKLNRVSEPAPRTGYIYILTITPEGLAAVVQWL